MEYLQRIILLVPPVLLALTVHEWAHAITADRLGDPTARMMGRVSLNPLRHLDPLGTVILFVSGMFGWAKPVPVTPANFREPSKAMLRVSLAGPLANLILAGLSALVYRLFLMDPALVMSMPGLFGPLYLMVKLSIIINVSLALFNMIPVPPLDGSKVLLHLLPYRKAVGFARLEPYGFIILMLLIFTGMVDRIVSPLVFLTVGLLTGGGL